MKTSTANFLAAAVAAATLVISAPVAASTTDTPDAGAPAAGTPAAPSIDAAAAEALARRENCLKCHGIDKEKSGPSYKRIAKKYKDKAGAEDKVMAHMKAGEMITLADGEEEQHRVIKATDENAIRNLTRWILSQ